MLAEAMTLEASWHLADGTTHTQQQLTQLLVVAIVLHLSCRFLSSK